MYSVYSEKIKKFECFNFFSAKWIEKVKEEVFRVQIDKKKENSDVINKQNISRAHHYMTD